MRGWALLALLATSSVRAEEPAGVSAVRGKRDGVIVLWPRVVPEATEGEPVALATALQERLVAIADRVADPSKRVVRPAPERVCPLEGGCRAVSLGAVLGHHEGGCFAVGLVGAADGGPVRLVPWAGEVSAKGGRELAHRQTPEDALVVREFVPCSGLIEALDDAKLEDVLRRVLAPADAVAPAP